MAIVTRRLGRVLSTKPQSNIFDPTEGQTVATTSTEDDKSTSGYGSTLSGQAALQRAAFERDKFRQEQAAAADALARQQAGAQAQEAYLRGQLTGQIPSMVSGEINTQEAAGRKYIEDQAAALLGQLQQRQTQATGLTQTGYSNLMNYLARNQPTAFAQAQRVMPTITETGLGQYMAGQGVSPAAAQEAARLANIQAAGGASNYNQLLNVLAAREAAGQTSRQAEAEMGLAGQLANLQAIYGQGTAGLEQQRLAALQELATVISNARLQASREQAAREQAIRDALAALYGTGYVKPPTETTGGGTTRQPTVTPEQVEAAITANPNIDPGVVAAAVSQAVAPTYLEDRLRGSAGNPLFGAMDQFLYAV